jgi:hypothetical protein
VHTAKAIAKKQNSVMLHEGLVLLCSLVSISVPVFHLEKEHEEGYGLTYHLQTK